MGKGESSIVVDTSGTTKKIGRHIHVEEESLVAQQGSNDDVFHH